MTNEKPEPSQQEKMLALIEESGDLEMKLRNVLFKFAICLRACRKCAANNKDPKWVDANFNKCSRCGGSGKLETDAGVKVCHVCCGTGLDAIAKSKKTMDYLASEKEAGK